MYDQRPQIFHRHDRHQNQARTAMNFIEIDRINNLAQTHESSSSNFDDDQVVQFRPNSHQSTIESDDSGVCSPPLWKNSSPSPSKSPSQPLLAHHNHRSLSPNSRAQAIIRGQWELMEMVKNMPESSYELSLKDLVEHPKIEISPIEEKSADYKVNQRGGVKVKRQESRRFSEKNVIRSGSFENNKGLFLNFGFSFFSLKSKKKKNIASNSSGRVSPKPEGLKVGGERDWWKKKFSGSSDSDSSKISNNSGSSGSTVSSGGISSRRSNSGGGRKKNGFLSSGCWPCFSSRSSKFVE